MGSLRLITAFFLFGAVHSAYASEPCKIENQFPEGEFQDDLSDLLGGKSELVFIDNSQLPMNTTRLHLTFTKEFNAAQLSLGQTVEASVRNLKAEVNLEDGLVMVRGKDFKAIVFEDRSDDSEEMITVEYCINGRYSNAPENYGITRLEGKLVSNRAGDVAWFRAIIE